MNRSYFLSRVRDSLFSGKLSKSQADGINKILDYWQAKWPKMSIDELAYLLATAKWETAHTMQPIVERGKKEYLMFKPYWPWIGRGLVQITWERNYKKYGIENPEDALKWPVALHVIFDGMIFGKFTGKKLGDYIGEGHRDYVGARRIINGTDKAKQIALIADGFRDALMQANSKPDPEKGEIKEGTPQTTGKPLAKSKTFWSQIAQWVAGGGAAALTALGEIPWQTALVVAGSVIILAGGYIIYERYLKSRDEGV